MSLQRKTPLRSRSPIKQGGTPIRPKKRKPSEFARIYHSDERVAFVASLPCAGCGWRPPLDSDWCIVVNAHTRTEGIARKAGYETIIPLCTDVIGSGCHDRQHQKGWSVLPKLETPEKRATAAAETHAAWLSHHGADQ